MKVYDKRQDKDKSAFKKLYEKLVGGVSKLLENKPREEVATKATSPGPSSSPKSSTWQVIGKLIENAFIRAILPGLRPRKKARPRTPNKQEARVGTLLAFPAIAHCVLEGSKPDRRPNTPSEGPVLGSDGLRPRRAAEVTDEDDNCVRGGARRRVRPRVPRDPAPRFWRHAPPGSASDRVGSFAIRPRRRTTWTSAAPPGSDAPGGDRRQASVAAVLRPRVAFALLEFPREVP